MNDADLLKMVDTALRHITGLKKLEPELRAMREKLTGRPAGASAERERERAFVRPG